MNDFEKIKEQAHAAAVELLDAAGLREGDLFVVGCSSSETVGAVIGKGSSLEAAKAVFDGIYPVLRERGILLAAQCCEHLNRALIVESETARAYGYPEVNAVPWEHGGGSFATVAYRSFEHPTAVEHIAAHAGMDIGHTMIGMHLREVAVPVRLSVDHIGKAPVVFARTRPKFIGGDRARYNEELK